MQAAKQQWLKDINSSHDEPLTPPAEPTSSDLTPQPAARKEVQAAQAAPVTQSYRPSPREQMQQLREEREKLLQNEGSASQNEKLSTSPIERLKAEQARRAERLADEYRQKEDHLPVLDVSDLNSGTPEKRGAAAAEAASASKADAEEPLAQEEEPTHGSMTEAVAKAKAELDEWHQQPQSPVQHEEVSLDESQVAPVALSELFESAKNERRKSLAADNPAEAEVAARPTWKAGAAAVE